MQQCDLLHSKPHVRTKAAKGVCSWTFACFAPGGRNTRLMAACRLAMPLASCGSAAHPAQTPPINVCQSTWVNGRPGTGCGSFGQTPQYRITWPAAADFVLPTEGRRQLFLAVCKGRMQARCMQAAMDAEIHMVNPPQVLSCSGRYEGPSCEIDINECVRATAGCAANAGCINTDGGYQCKCYWGYDGAASQ